MAKAKKTVKAQKKISKKPAKSHVRGAVPHRNMTLSNDAFAGIISKAIEVYKKETFGLLLGRKHKKHYHVTGTYAFQTAERGYEFVNIKANRINRINYALGHLSNKTVVGDFHSHPEGPEKLSPTDREDLLRRPTTLTCLVNIYKTKKCEKWKFCEDKSICGTIGSKYLIRIIAYEVNHKTRSIDRIKIVCPYVRKINKLGFYKAMAIKC